MLGAGSVQSGVAFGPPTTIFRLRMRCTGGAATVTVVATKRSGGSDTYMFSLASGGDVGANVCGRLQFAGVDKIRVWLGNCGGDLNGVASKPAGHEAGCGILR